MTLSVQFYTLIAMIGMGIVLGMAIDTYRLLLRVRLRKNWTKCGWDFLFWLLYTVILFDVLYRINEGTLRIHVFLAIFCGFALYKALLDVLYIHFMLFIYRIVSKTIYFSIKVLKILFIRPAYWLIMGIWHVLKRVIRLVCRMIRFVAHLIYQMIRWLFRIFWRMLPKRVQKRFRLLYYRVYESIQKIYQPCLTLYNKFKSWWNQHK